MILLFLKDGFFSYFVAACLWACFFLSLRLEDIYRIWLLTE